MTVKELIETLNEVEDKNKIVCVYNLEDDRLQIVEHYMIDFNIRDRLDINAN